VSDLTFACVLKAGPAGYAAAEVAWLHAGVNRHLPGVRFVCLSDMDVECERVPLLEGWPGWWSKLELFRPDLVGPILYADLDTLIVGSLADIAGAGKLTLLSDFYHPAEAASGLMFLPEEDRAAVWRAFTADPDRIMRRCADFDQNGVRGDGKFLGEMLGDRAARWQAELPGQVVSYKLHVRERTSSRETGNGDVPKGARVICFHGRPRPWEVKEWRLSSTASRPLPTMSPTRLSASGS
jgi:hypothetical protein